MSGLKVVFVFLLPSLIAACMARRNERVTKKVFFDIKIGKEAAGRIVIGLFGDIVPRTVEKFYNLTTRTNEAGYKGSIFYKVIADSLIEGGDYENNYGTGGSSIFGGPFDDENFILQHKAGYVSMANSGPDSNESRFFLVTTATPWLDGRNVVFGKVLEGFETLSAIENVPVNFENRPFRDVTIADSGSLPLYTHGKNGCHPLIFN